MTKAKNPEGPTQMKKSDNPRPQNRHLKPIQKGEVRNPRGRPIGSRAKFSEAMVSDFLADWHEHGTDVLARVRATEPATYLRVASVLVPKEMNVAVTADRNSLGIDPALWRAFQRVLAAIEEVAPSESDPAQVFETLERLVRFEYAKTIDVK